MNIIKRSIWIAMMVIPGLFMQAQAQKIGHINSAELLLAMPEITVADKKLEEVAIALEKRNQALYAEYEKKLQLYQGNPNMTDTEKKELEQDLVDMQKRITNFQTSAQEELAKKKEEFYSPILDRADAAIKSVAKENGYMYILDTSLGTVLFAEDANNVMSLVKTKLGLN